MTEMTRLLRDSQSRLRLLRAPRVAARQRSGKAFAQGPGMGQGRHGRWTSSRQAGAEAQRAGDARRFGRQRRHHAPRRKRAVPPGQSARISPEVQKQIGTDAERERREGSRPQDLPHHHPAVLCRRRAATTASRRSSRCGSSASSRTIALRSSGMLYYNRRSTKHDADVLFPFFWNLRDDQTTRPSSAPSCTARHPASTTTGSRPLFFSGSAANERLPAHPAAADVHPPQRRRVASTSIGPLLLLVGRAARRAAPSTAETSTTASRLSSSPARASARATSSCRRSSTTSTTTSSTTRRSTCGARSSGSTRRRPTPSMSFRIFWHNWGKNEDHVTVFPLFHYGYEGNTSLLINPLFLLVARREGRVDVRDLGLRALPRAHQARHGHAALLALRRSGHRSLAHAALSVLLHVVEPARLRHRRLPVLLHCKRYDLSETTWITPFFQHTHDLEGWATNIYPFLFLGRTNETHAHGGRSRSSGTSPRRTRAPPWLSALLALLPTTRRSRSCSATPTTTSAGSARRSTGSSTSSRPSPTARRPTAIGGTSSSASRATRVADRSPRSVRCGFPSPPATRQLRHPTDTVPHFSCAVRSTQVKISSLRRWLVDCTV